MNNFPNEVIIQIYGHLNQQDRAQGRLLRRNWDDAIRSIQYQTVYIYSARALNSLVENVAAEPEISNRIERLVINFPQEESIHENNMDVDENSQQIRTRINRNININRNNLNELLRGCQNLTALHSSVSGLQTRGNSVLPSATRIESISESDNVSLVHHILSAGPCPRLNALRSTTFSNYPLLNMAPGLRTLYLTRLDVQVLIIDFSNFELIHQQMPHLRSLRLLNLDFRGRVDFPRSFRTAPLVTHFSTNVARGALHVLRYVTRKYPGLVSLEYEIGASMSAVRQASRLYTDGWLPFFTTIGAALERLTYGSHVKDLNFVLGMNLARCQINYLSLDRLSQNLIFDLTNSHQATFIATLVLKETDCYLFQFLTGLPHLRKLKLINCRHHEFNGVIELVNILHNAPETLQSLSFEGIRLAAGGMPIVNRNITSLSFHSTPINREGNSYISLCFPALNRLKVKLTEIEDRILVLSDVNLAEFRFVGTRGFPGNIESVDVGTIINGERRIYYVNNYDRKAIHKDVISLIDPSYTIPVSSTPRRDVLIAFAADLTFVCNSLENIVFV